MVIKRKKEVKIGREGKKEGIEEGKEEGKRSNKKEGYLLSDNADI